MKNDNMKITHRLVPIRDLVEGYKDSGEEGVVGYGGKLDIRPPYQREFVYNETQQELVIDSILENYPLNSIYWVENEDGQLEVLDGQQRILSICKYHANKFSHEDHGHFHSLRERQEDFLNYNLWVNVCKGGTVVQKMKWFDRINTAGEKLTPQELLNAIFHGKWVADAKKRFSRQGGNAHQVSSNYVKAVAERQGYLETALRWYKKDGEDIKDCMDRIHKTEDAERLWEFYRGVIDWVEKCFPTDYYRKEMKGVDWGSLYREYGKLPIDADANEKNVKWLMEHPDVTNGKGIYKYIFTGKESDLSRRDFDEKDKRTTYETQDGKCASCGKECTREQMQADHIKPFIRGGRSIADNCQMLCEDCHLDKTNRQKKQAKSI